MVNKVNIFLDILKSIQYFWIYDPGKTDFFFIFKIYIEMFRLKCRKKNSKL